MGGVALVLASAAAFAGYWGAGLVVAITLFLAGALLLTGTTRKCPVNRAAGIDTTR